MAIQVAQSGPIVRSNPGLGRHRVRNPRGTTSQLLPLPPASVTAAPRIVRSDIPSVQLSPDDLTNALFEGDCLRWLPTFPDASVDMVLCDLPYGTTRNPWDSVVPLEKLWRQYQRVVKPRGAIVLTSQGLFTAKLIMSQERLFRYKLSWEKSKPTNFLNVRRQPLRKHEDVCVFYRRQPLFNPQMGEGEPYDKGVRKNQLSGSYGDFVPAHVKSAGGRFPTDVVYFKTAESEGTGEVWHPTQKPVALGRYLVRTYTKPGDLVLDNAFGSGSFLVSSVLEGRRFVGIEKNREGRLFKRNPVDYVALAAKRIREAQQILTAGRMHRSRPSSLDTFDE